MVAIVILILSAGVLGTKQVVNRISGCKDASCGCALWWMTTVGRTLSEYLLFFIIIHSNDLYRLNFSRYYTHVLYMGVFWLTLGHETTSVHLSIRSAFLWPSCIMSRYQQNESEHCLLLALPCGRDANDVRTQTHALKNSLITYLLQKQAAGIINVQGPQASLLLEQDRHKCTRTHTSKTKWCCVGAAFHCVLVCFGD